MKTGENIRNFELRTLPSIWQVAADGEGYFPLTKLLHCNLKYINKVSLLLLIQTH